MRVSTPTNNPVAFYFCSPMIMKFSEIDSSNYAPRRQAGTAAVPGIDVFSRLLCSQGSAIDSVCAVREIARAN